MTSNGQWVYRDTNVDFSKDGVTIILTRPLKFLDRDSRCWVAPKDTQGDGASIPRPLWTIIGSPLRGKYRDASILHDWYCSVRTRPWRQVHRMFYDAMICSDVSITLAKVMYAAVFWGGPHWSDMDQANIEVLRNLGIADPEIRRRIVKLRIEDCVMPPVGAISGNYGSDASDTGEEVELSQFSFRFPSHPGDAEWAVEVFQNIAVMELGEIDRLILARVFGDDSAVPPDIDSGVVGILQENLEDSQAFNEMVLAAIEAEEAELAQLEDAKSEDKPPAKQLKEH